MEQLRAISCCRRPRSYRKRNTSLILRMDKAFWGIWVPPLARGETCSRLSSAAFCSCLESLIPRRQYHSGFRRRLFAAGIIHIPGMFIHIPVIVIHILPYSLFTSPRNPYSHAPEYAAGCHGRHLGAEGSALGRNRQLKQGKTKWK